MDKVTIKPIPPIELLRAALNELGVPQPDYPAPVANAIELIRDAVKTLDTKGNWPK